MKRKFTYFGVALAVLLLLSCTLTALFPVAAGEPLPSLLYGVPGREDNVTYSTVELYERLFGVSPTEAEAKYLGTTGITFSYNSTVPNNLLSTEYHAEEGRLSVTIRPYTYVAANGQTVTWLPVRATIDGEPMDLTECDGVYRCDLENLFYTEDFDMQVEYAWSVTVPREVLSALRTSAYSVGSDALARLSEHEKAMASYNAAMERYEAWQAYLAWQKVYDDYLLAAEAHRVAKEAYDDYCAEYDIYEDELANYNAWQDYFDYSESTADQIAAYNKYMAYLKQIKPVEEKLALMESLFVTDSNNWQMYGSIMGGSVTKVLEDEDLLVNKLGYGEAFIRLAGDATEVLRKLLPEYARLRNEKYATEHDRIEALYGYYTKNYAELGKQFKNLYTVLKSLYEDYTVFLAIQSLGKLDHYVQFVGQLYVISTCLDESGYRDPKWTIYDGNKAVSLSAVVESVHLLKDGVWDPAKSPMPAYAEPAEYIAPMDPPAGNPPSKKPTPPTEVKNPGDAPTKPDNPYQNGIPDEATHPGDAPAAPVFDSVTKALMEEIQKGILTQYQGAFEPITLSYTATVDKKVSIQNLKTVSFYDAHGVLLDSFQLNYGESVSYPLPELESTAQYHYTPRGWISIDGSAVDLVTVKSDLALMPAYSKTLRSYQITWILDGEAITKTEYYNDQKPPVPPAKWSLEDQTAGHYHYTFSGWDSEPRPVTGDAVYRGEMLGSLRNYTVTWVLYGDRTVTEEWQALSTPTFTGDTARPADSRVYRFVGWRGPTGALQGDTVYTAQYESVKLAVGGSGAAMDVEHTDSELRVHATASSLDISAAVDYAIEKNKRLVVSWENGFALSFGAEELNTFDASGCRHIVLQSQTEGDTTVFELDFYNSAWKKLETLGEGMRVTLPQERFENCETVFFAYDKEGWKRLEDGVLHVTGSVKLRRALAYDLSIAPHQQCNTVSMQPNAVAGDRVSLKLKCVFGYEVSGATVLDADGNAIPVDKDMTFIMPKSPVSITLNVTAIQYTVTFVVDGKVVSRAEYALNEAIKLPDDPTLTKNDGYVYSFVSWGDVPAVAAGEVRDMVFEAQFSRAQENVDYDTELGGSMLFDVYLPLAGVLILLLVAGFITWRVLKKRKKKKQAAEKSATTE